MSNLDTKIITLHDIINNDIKTLKSLIEKYDVLHKTYGKKSCLLIGSNNSIKDFNAAEYVNNTDRLVIRINRPAVSDMIQHYGNRCDMIIGTVYAQELSKNFENKINLAHADINTVSLPYFNTSINWFTTGLIAILICEVIFDDVEIFGFGYDDTIEPVTKYVSCHDNHNSTQHMLNFEHNLILNELKTNKNFHRFENNHPELKYKN